MKRVRVLTYAELKALETGKGNRAMRRAVKRKTGKELENLGEPMSYAKRNMKISKIRTKAPALCKECHLRPRRNGSAYCGKCSEAHHRKIAKAKA